MPSLTEGKLRFDFPEGWEVTQYDSWTFYEKHFQGCCSGNKAMDFLAIDPDQDSLWLIEAKDYRIHPRTKSIALWEETAVKARDTLAGLVAAKASGLEPEKTWSQRALAKAKLRIALHLEQPAKPSKLFPKGPFDLAKVQEKLKQLVRPIDAHPRVTDLKRMGRAPWSAVSIP